MEDMWQYIFVWYWKSQTDKQREEQNKSKEEVTEF